MPHSPKRYKKGDSSSYTLGVYPTLELLAARSQIITEVILSSRAGGNEGAGKIRDLCAAGGIPCTENERAIQRLSPKENCLAVGLFTVYTEALEKGMPHVALVRPSNRGNAGTIMRTMAGFGFHDLALIGASIDPLDPQTIRASMGSVFRLRVEKFQDAAVYLSTHRRATYAFRKDAPLTLDEVGFKGIFTLVFGSEGPGLEEDIPGSTEVSIPQSRDIDSLNLSTAVAVALYKARRGL